MHSVEILWYTIRKTDTQISTDVEKVFMAISGLIVCTHVLYIDYNIQNIKVYPCNVESMGVLSSFAIAYACICSSLVFLVIYREHLHEAMHGKEK